MKKLLLVVSVCLFAAACTEKDPYNSKDAWAKLYPEIEKNIKAPEFTDKDYLITDFGAVPNDSAFLNHEAINNAILAASTSGGGRVVVPAGVWHTGGIVLKSGVNLHLEEGSTLLFTTDQNYYPIVLTSWEGLDCYNKQPMVYAYNEKNIGITGKGTIDGGASRDNWWAMCGAVGYGWKEGIVSQRTGRPRLLEMAENNVPVEQRIMGPEDGMRPQLVNIYKCDGVLIEDVTMLRSPFWVIHPLLSNNITVRGVKVINDGPNGDGCDPESCSNVLIENCFFDTGDDCIAIKSGRNNDGRRRATPSQNIIVRGCQMKNGHGGVVIGSEISGGYKNLFVEDCIMDSPLLDRVIRIKTSTCRGGVVENVYVRNVEVGQCKEAVLRINLQYENNEKCQRGFIPTVRNVYLENVNCKESRYGVLLIGLEEGTNIYNINVTNCNFDGVKGDGRVSDGYSDANSLDEAGNGGSLNSITGLVSDINFNNLKINGQLVESPKVND